MSNDQLIQYEGHEYADGENTRLMISAATFVKDNLPPHSQDKTRLWRGNRPGEVGQNPSFTNSLVGIAFPFMRMYGGLLSYVDVPTNELGKYLCTGCVAAGSEFILPSHLASTAKVAAKIVENRLIVDTEIKDIAPIGIEQPQKDTCHRPTNIPDNGSGRIEVIL